MICAGRCPGIAEQLYQMEIVEPEKPPYNQERMNRILLTRVDLALRRIEQLDARLRAARL